MARRLTASLGLLVLFSATAVGQRGGAPGNQPRNFIIILTDDMDMTLMPYMPKTNQLIGGQGATFENYFITTPLCCPSRASRPPRICSRIRTC